MLHLTTLLIALFITIALIPIMTRLAERYRMVDYPNPRKVHVRPIPRIGGAAIAVGAFIPIVLWSTSGNFIMAFVAGAAILVISGFIDDMRGLDYKIKFLAQILAALVMIYYGDIQINSLGGLLPDGVVLADWFAVPLTLVAIVGIINAINLADGLDGLAGGISLLSFCCIGYLAYILEDYSTLLICLAMAGAIFGFLRFNTYPASLFMGDTGSQLLGFVAGVLAIKITQSDNALSPILPLIILGFPILDTLTVMIERISEGRSPFSPDKNHFHHRLLRFGLVHSEAVFVIYIIQSIMVVSAIFLKYHSDWMLLIGYVVFAVLVFGTFAVGDGTGFQFKRPHLLDHVIKGKLKKIQEEQWIIRISFNVTKFLIPQLFLFATLFPARIPGYFSTGAILLCLLIVFFWIFKKQYMPWAIRVALYLSIPLIAYLNDQGQAAWFHRNIEIIYQIFFFIGAFVVILTVKYSRRKQGFKATTMDFLILFIAIVVPNLPDQMIQSHRLGSLAVEIIVMFFSYEVLITEQRGRLDSLAAPTLMALMLIAVRGITGV